MQQHNIVRRFGDGNLILKHGAGLGVEIAGLLRDLYRPVQFADAVAIFFGAAQRGVVSGNALKRMAGFQ